MKAFSVIVVLTVISFLQGCASSAGMEIMIADSANVTIDVPLGSSVKVIVTGGDEIVTTDEFTAALKASIKKAKLFDNLVAVNADYDLTVILLSMTGSALGFNMSGSNISLWILRHHGEEIWRSQIQTRARATVGDAFVGITRRNMAIKRAAQKAIEKGLTQIGQIEPTDPIS